MIWWWLVDTLSVWVQSRLDPCPKDTYTWHSRCGHRDPEAIKRLVHCHWFPQWTLFSSYAVWMLHTAKNAQKAISKKPRSISAEILDLVHSDACSPMQTATPSGNRYILINDDWWLQQVYNKPEVPAKIKEYVKYVQTKFNKTPKVIRSDRGGEYTGDDLTRFFRSEGIQVEHSVPYTPQQNGVAERKNYYLVEMTRSMLLGLQVAQ